MAEGLKAFNSANFEAEVLKSKTPVLVDFWAEWCGPCRMIGPVIEEIAKAYADKIVVGKVNVDESIDLAKTYGVMTIPTLALFKGGELVDKSVGLVSKSAIEKLIDTLLTQNQPTD